MKQFEIHDLEIRRRGFLSAGLISFGAVGIASLIGSSSALAQVAGQPAGWPITGIPPGTVPSLPDGIDPADLVDPPMPEGFKENQTLDGRYPVSYRRSVPQASRVMAAHFDAIATRNYRALARTMHFPFGIIEGLDGVVLESAADLTDNRAPFSLNFAPNGSRTSGTPSRLVPGAYDILKSIEVLNFDPIRVNMAMTFDRYNRFGFRTARCEGIYCVTNNNGKWAIQMMSTIWKPDDLIGRQWPDAEEAALRLRENHVLSYQNDVDIIDRPRPHRGVRLGIERSGGTSFQDAKNDGTADLASRMAGYRAAGVTSRLNIGDPVPPDDVRMRTDPADRREPEEGPHEEKWRGETTSWSEVGVPNWWEARMSPESRIIHASSDKVHRFAGAARYNAAGEYLNNSMEVTAVVLGSGGEWVGNGSTAYITVHDRLGDDMN